MDQIKQIIESLLFVSDSPLTIDHIQRAIPEAETDTVKKALLELKEEYDLRNGGFLLHEVAGGFQFRTKKEFKEWIRRLFQPTPPKLSTAAMETLAIVAYRQPVLRNEIEHIRGVNSGNSLRILLERRLIRVLGRREIPGRPLVYATTRKFLETFDLKDLKDLPSPKEIEGMEIKPFPSPAQDALEITADEPETPSKNLPENIA
jgi:segregation and condensation protein B